MSTTQSKQTLQLWRRLASLGLSVGFLMVPLTMFYIACTAPTSPRSTMTNEPSSTISPLSTTRVAESLSLSPDAMSTSGVQLVEDKRTKVVHVRVTATGDELIIDAETGKLLQIIDQRTGEAINPRTS
ncbi:hypothetical protein [Tuwongella immobilis]|uniref:Uncharacterized protein n=1 Tax=Tuwongella immobilis TaxID=692036 RepID=A0A6C2YPG6_9BACT|nr:hypothetical protein [Tuwongella immobilis]VIP02772.1 unnamed protein product [Tuwongella immobilis]VTS02405.1 unnamed protein product [Tuwongella immobilis]